LRWIQVADEEQRDQPVTTNEDDVARRYGLPLTANRLAFGSLFSKLNTRPVRASVYASTRCPRGHRGETRGQDGVAAPFSWGSFIPDHVPVYPGARLSPFSRSMTSPCIWMHSCQGGSQDNAANAVIAANVVNVGGASW